MDENYGRWARFPQFTGLKGDGRQGLWKLELHRIAESRRGLALWPPLFRISVAFPRSQRDVVQLEVRGLPVDVCDCLTQLAVHLVINHRGGFAGKFGGHVQV